MPALKIAVSACLLSARCRWDADVKTYPYLEELLRGAAVVPVCPEIGIGLEVPRDPIRLVASPAGVRLIQPSSGRDLTDEIDRFAMLFLERTGNADAFLLKSRSPSCALRDADVFRSADSAEPVGKGPGAFANRLFGAFPAADRTFWDEKTLLDEGERSRFLEIMFEKHRDIK